MGLANYLRDFVEGFSHLAKPLTDLTSPKVEFAWTDVQEMAFQNLKLALTRAPVLRHPDPSQPYYLETDASSFTIVGVLLQQHHEKLHPVAYFSRKLCPAEQNYSIHDKELLAIIDALRMWRHLLLGATHPITIPSDHRNLAYFQKTTTIIATTRAMGFIPGGLQLSNSIPT